ncbi:alkaline phosphatase D family protein, partial [Micromonospora globispora]
MAAGGPLYRRLSYGPLLDVFVLDMRTYKDPNDG